MAYTEPVKVFKLKKDPTWVDGSELPQYLSVFEATQPNVIPNGEFGFNKDVIPNGEFGFNKEGLVVLKNNTTSLVEILDNLCIALTAVGVALAANTPTADAGAALGVSVTALQLQISNLLASPGTEEV